VLTPQEAELLFETLREMAAEGRTVIFISHKLHEVKAVATGSRCSAADARSPPWRRRTRRSRSLAALMVEES